MSDDVNALAHQIAAEMPGYSERTAAASSADISWWTRARYGLFVHWGPYAVAGRGEWVMNRERIPFEEYRDRYAANFRAENYDPRDWARLAKEAGMGYVVLTAKHHDGFCLWATKTTRYNAAELGPGRDLIRPYVEALRAEGLKVGLYLSFADWSHPDYHGRYHRSFARAWPPDSGEARRRFIDFVQAQLTELLSDYGNIDLLWWDGAYPEPTEGAETNALARRLQPGILINDRNNDPGDFATCEQKVTAARRPWEACLTLTPHSWGYHPGEPVQKSAKQVIDTLLNTAGQGGNLLLNVGPKPDGTVPGDIQRILREAGQWLARNREFLPDSGRAPFSWTNWGRYTVKDGRIFAHILYDTGGELCIADIANRVKRVTLLDGGRELPFEQEPGGRIFVRDLPHPIDPIATSLALDVEGEPAPLQP